MLTTDSQGRYLYREQLDDARRALRRCLVAGYATLLFGGLGVGLAIALTGGL
jgi:hypothetical protein